MSKWISIGVSLLVLGIGTTAHAEDGHESATYWSKREPFKEGAKAFAEAKALLGNEYLDNLSEEDLFRGAVMGMLSHAGNRKWDSLLSPDDYAMLSRELEGQLAGIGVEIDISSQPGNANIMGTFPGTPAERAGLKGGDRILKVNGKPLRAQKMEQGIREIAGKPGTNVTLTILREEQIFDKQITRANVVIPVVTEQQLPDGASLVWVRVFTSKTPALLHQTLTKIAARKPHGLVLDLRGNQGGLFDKMVDCAGDLLPRGSTIAVEQLRGKREEAVKTARDPVLRDVPIVVLVDGSTASSAEILTGALRDVAHARVVGSKTQGKWNAQRLTELSNGYAIKFTIGLFKTPKGEAPDEKGLEPDVPVDLNEHAIERAQRMSDTAAKIALDAQLRAAVALLK